jgi:hypothetical protein
MRTNPTKFYAYLTDIYKGARADQKLSRKHQISNRSKNACQLLKFTDRNCYSIMTKQPTMEDAIKLIEKNKQIQRVSYKKYEAKKEKMKGQFQLGILANKTRQPKQPVVKPASAKEISILWGAIKITL